MAKTDLERLAALDRAIGTLENRRYDAAAIIGARATDYRARTATGWQARQRYGGSLKIRASTHDDCVEVHDSTYYQGGESEYSDTIPIAYLNGTMTIDTAIKPRLESEAAKVAAVEKAQRAAELAELARLQAKYGNP